MSLRDPFMIKSSIGTAADTAVELKAESGESFVVDDILINGSDDTYIKIFTETTTVGFFRVGTVLGNHLSFPLGFSKHSHDLDDGTSVITASTEDSAQMKNAFGVEQDYGYVQAASGDVNFKRAAQYTQTLKPPKTILGFMKEMGWFNGYPVQEGETLSLQVYTSGSALNDVAIIYSRYDGGDIQNTLPNGSKADTTTNILYGDTGAAITTAGDIKIDTSLMPDEFTSFPFAEKCPTNRQITLLGILGSPVCDWDTATDFVQTKYLKMIRDTNTLFDKDRNGILFYQNVPTSIDVGTIFGEGVSLVGNYSDLDAQKPFIFPEPLVFEGGEELNTYITTAISTNAGSIAQAYSAVGLIAQIEKG